MLSEIQSIIENQGTSIEAWFAEKFKQYPPFIYNSVDLRYSGHKITAVDTNIFPAGFNNLSAAARDASALELKKYLHKDIAKILLITEFHTRNLKYLENISTLKKIIENTGREVFLASFNPEFTQAINIEDALGQELTIYPLERKNDSIITINGYEPDLIIFNNDLTSGSPEILKNIKQEIIPPTGMGWYRRTKYEHFQKYNHIASEFAKEFNFDPFFITTELGFCKKVNFKERKGLECIALETEKTLQRINEKYKQHNITSEPYVYIKANQGTYGMGIMTAKNADDVFAVNKKTRNKMNSLKSKKLNEQILIQEGIETIDNYQGAPCEPFIYLINGKATGSILRINANKDAQTNLNSTGAEFIAADNLKDFSTKLPTYAVIAQLAALAAKMEEYQNE